MANASIRNLVGDLRRVIIFALLIAGSSTLFSCSSARPPAEAKATEVPIVVAEDAIDINSATTDELEKIPRIGPKLAERIVAFRDRYGPFRRTEQLLLVQGISEKSFREIRPMIKVR